MRPLFLDDVIDDRYLPVVALTRFFDEADEYERRFDTEVDYFVVDLVERSGFHVARDQTENEYGRLIMAAGDDLVIYDDGHLMLATQK